MTLKRRDKTCWDSIRSSLLDKFVRNSWNVTQIYHLRSNKMSIRKPFTSKCKRKKTKSETSKKWCKSSHSSQRGKNSNIKGNRKKLVIKGMKSYCNDSLFSIHTHSFIYIHSLWLVILIRFGLSSEALWYLSMVGSIYRPSLISLRCVVWLGNSPRIMPTLLRKPSRSSWEQGLQLVERFRNWWFYLLY